jgi:hypothetical protein
MPGCSLLLLDCDRIYRFSSYLSKQKLTAMSEYDSSDQSECEVAVALTTPITPCPPFASNNGDIEYGLSD